MEESVEDTFWHKHVWDEKPEGPSSEVRCVICGVQGERDMVSWRVSVQETYNTIQANPSL
jgi:hypothetical protein